MKLYSKEFFGSLSVCESDVYVECMRPSLLTILTTSG